MLLYFALVADSFGKKAGLDEARVFVRFRTRDWLSEQRRNWLEVHTFRFESMMGRWPPLGSITIYRVGHCRFGGGLLLTCNRWHRRRLYFGRLLLPAKMLKPENLARVYYRCCDYVQPDFA